jgi:hypothetical protein
MDRADQKPAANIVRVGFNQQQRQIIEKLKADEAFAGRSDAEILKMGFVNWLKSEGRLPSK